MMTAEGRRHQHARVLMCVWGGFSLAIHVPHQVLGQHQRTYLQISEAQQEQQLP